MLHAHFADYRVNGEWFFIPPQVNIVETVKRFVEEYSVGEQPSHIGTDKLQELMEYIFEPTKNEIAAEINGEPTTFFISALIGFWFASMKPANNDKPRNTKFTALLLKNKIVINECFIIVSL